MKIGVIGAGALGLYYGAMLQRGGHQVRFLLRRDLQAIRQHGLQVDSVNGDFHLSQVQGFASVAEIGPVDLVLVGLKTFANAQLAELVEPLLGENTCILTLQNGLGNEELLASSFGAERILGGVAFLCSNRAEPGRVQHLGEGKIRLGEFSTGLTKRSSELAKQFIAAGVPCEAVCDLRRTRWEKLVWNIPFNGLSALLGKNVTQLLAQPQSRKMIVQIMQEVVAGANAQRLTEAINGDHFIPRMIHLSEQMDSYQPSMMLDRLAERPLELAAIYAKPLQLAKTVGIDMQRTRMLYNLLSSGEGINQGESVMIS